MSTVPSTDTAATDTAATDTAATDTAATGTGQEPSPVPRGAPRTSRDPHELSGAQKLMIVVLSMTVFGLADLIAELIPSYELGPVELEIAYFAFIPVVLAGLFSPLWVAIGAPLGAIVFAELMLGDFSGIGEIEGYLQALVGIFVAGSLVRDPRKPRQLWLAAIVFVTIDKLSSGVIDVIKAAVGVDEDAAGVLIGAVIVNESIEFVSSLLITGILFGAIPAALLAPRLYGKIEPLMGLRPRDPQNPPRLGGRHAGTVVTLSVLAIVLAASTAVFSAWEEFTGQENAITTVGQLDAEDAHEEANEDVVAEQVTSDFDDAKFAGEFQEEWTQEHGVVTDENRADFDADLASAREEAIDEEVGDVLEEQYQATTYPVLVWTSLVVSLVAVGACVAVLLVIRSRRRAVVATEPTATEPEAARSGVEARTEAP